MAQNDTLDATLVPEVSYPFFSLRLLFYLVHPKEIPDTDDVKKVPVYANEVLPSFFFLIFLELLVKYYYTGSGFRVNDTITSLGAGVASQTTRFLMRGLDVFVYIWIFENWRIWTLPLHNWWAWILAFLAVDLVYYWLHRVNHVPSLGAEVSILWASHQTHHSSEEYNLSTALRQSMTSSLYGWVLYLPMAFLGFTPTAYVVHVQLNTLIQFWIHTALVGNLGFLELFLNTPSHHRVHHGRNPYCVDKNYAGALIIWDRMFGTFEPENPEEPVVYGLISPVESFNGIWVQVNYYVYSISRFNSYKNLKDKFLSLVMGPGWQPGTDRLGDPAALPPIENPIKIYDVRIPSWKTVYSIIHFIMQVYFFDYCSRKYSNWHDCVVCLVSTSIFISLGNIGSVMDNRRWINVAEILRCGILWWFYGLEYLQLPDAFVTFSRFCFLGSVLAWAGLLLFQKTSNNPNQNIPAKSR